MNKQFILFLVCSGLLVVSFLSCSREEPSITAPPVVVLNVQINEVYSQGTPAAPDWVELINPSSSQVDVSGYKLYDAAGKAGSNPKLVIPSGTTISAGSLLAVNTDTSDVTGLELASTGETIWLENASGTIIDSVAFPALGKDTSYARIPDGSSNWAIRAPATKGANNSSLPLLMNEIYSRGVVGAADWIEIYNPSASPVNLAGYKIYDIGGQGGTKPKREFPSGASVPALGFYVVVTDSAYSVSDLSAFGLSSAGEQAWFEDPAGIVIDTKTFPTMGLTESYGRKPDGSSTWQLLSTITRGTSNN